MDFQSYKEYIIKLEFGKTLPDAKYIHIDLIPYVPQPVIELLMQAQIDLSLQKVVFNIIKFHTKDFKISLLNYPMFFKESYPALMESCTIDFVRNKHRITNYKNSSNPPILHRKETFLPHDHPSVPLFREITKEGEEAGLYKDTRQIGFKENWERLIKRKGYQLKNGRLIKVADVGLQIKPEKETKEIDVARYKTAIDRHKLSAPMIKLARHGYLDKTYSIFDYGCGKGDDLRELQAHGINAEGWDPAYFPKNEKKKQDIVNLGFVINVIEDPRERRDCLIDAYKLTKKLLVVAAMLGGASVIEQFTPHGDGVLTSRKTFQKYYSQTELKIYIEQTLLKTAVAVGPGIFFIFKDEIEEEQFLVNKEHRKVQWLKLSKKAKKTKTSKKKDRKTIFEKNKEIIEDFSSLCFDLGRKPITVECDFVDQVRRVFGSIPKAHKFVVEYFGEELFKEAKEARIEDLKVYFALSFFSKRKPLTRMPSSLKRDIKEFFGSYSDALEISKELLYSVGNSETILQACEYSAGDLKIGYLDGNHNLQLHVSLIQHLPAVLRIYIGCATQLFGDVEEADLIKIHIQSSKISLMRYDDFDSKPIPELKQRIKIKLKEQQIDIFEYGETYESQPLYLKSRYLSPSNKFYDKQIAFDEKLIALNLFDFEGFGPPKEEFFEKIKGKKLSLSPWN